MKLRRSIGLALLLALSAGFGQVTSLAAPAPAPVVLPPTNVAPPAAVPSARIIMLRVYVSDISRSEKFYHEVLGATAMQRMGETVRIMMLPGGAMPGIILIQSPEVATMHGSFVVQVSDLRGTLDKASANGGTLKNTSFSQQMAGVPARSSHFADPDGNLVEVLQIGGTASPKP